MCLLFGEHADAIFADTGFEHEQIYRRIEAVEQVVREKIRPDFQVIRVKNPKYENGLPQAIIESKFYPSFRARFCTRMFKIEPIDQHLEQFKDEGVELMIGLNADEIHMRTGNHGLHDFVNYSYPLADNGITRAMCVAILGKVGLVPNFPPYMKRGGCVGCYFKSKKEFEAMARMNPEEFLKVAELEEMMQDRREEYYHIHAGIGEPLRRFFERIKNTPLMFSMEEIYPVINDATTCGVFCHR